MKRIGIIGGGRFGSALAQFLAERGTDILLLERDRDVVQRLSDAIPRVVQGDGTAVDVLREAGFGDCDTAVVAIGTDLEGSILATLNLKEMGVPHVVAKAASDAHGKVLQRVGANRVLYADRDMAVRLGRMLLSPSILDYTEVTEGAGIEELRAPAGLIGKTLSQARIRNVHGVIVLALRKGGANGLNGRTVLAPSGDDIIEENDVLVLFGPEARLRQVEKEFA